MADISNELDAIMAARYGKDVRQSIHDGLEKVNDVVEEAGYDKVLASLIGTVVIYSGYLNYNTGTRTVSYITRSDGGNKELIHIIAPKLKTKSIGSVSFSGLPMELPSDGQAYVVYLNISTYEFSYKNFSEINYESDLIPLFSVYSDDIYLLNLTPQCFYVNSDSFYESRFYGKEKMLMLLNSINYNTTTKEIFYTSKDLDLYCTFGKGNGINISHTRLESLSPIVVDSYSGAKVVRMNLLNGQLDVYDALTSFISNKYMINLVVIYQNVVYPLGLDERSLYINGLPFNNQKEKPVLTINQLMKPLFGSETTKIVLGGDSITHGVGGTGFNQNGEVIIDDYRRNPDGYCWANLFKDYIESTYNATVLNNACTGTSASFWNVNKEDLIPLDTDIFILTVGTNDRNVYTSGSDTPEAVRTRLKNNLKYIVEYCQTHDINIILASPIPASAQNENYTADGITRIIKMFEINEIIREVATEHYIEYINMYNLLYYYYWEKDLNFEDYFVDGLHPNDSMYKVMFYLYLKGLNLAPSYIPVE